MTRTYTATFDLDKLMYRIDGKAIDAVVERGAAQAVAQDARARIAILSDRLQGESITLQEFYDQMKVETKYLHMAEAAIGRGGFDQMRPQDYERVEQIVLAQWEGVPGKFPGMRAFVEDISNGRYGNDTLSPGMANRASMYAFAGRSTQAGERLMLRFEHGDDMAERIKGALDHCDDCINWAALGPMPLKVMMDKYPIGASVCSGYCGCEIVTWRKDMPN